MLRPVDAMADMIFSARGMSSKSALPAPLPYIFGTGQPMLTSITSNGASASLRTASFMTRGSEPKSCTAFTFSPSAVKSSSFVALLPYKSPFALTISVKASPAPYDRHRLRKAKSV